MRKSTNKELVEILEQRSPEGRYNTIIEKARANYYHDFKGENPLPKISLVNDLAEFPALADVREMVENGEFDDSMFDDD